MTEDIVCPGAAIPANEWSPIDAQFHRCPKCGFLKKHSEASQHTRQDAARQLEQIESRMAQIKIEMEKRKRRKNMLGF